MSPFEQIGFLKVDGMVQVTMAVWSDEKQDWLWSKRGIIYGGRHGDPPMLEQDSVKLEATVTTEVRTLLRAIQNRWAQR